MYSASIDYSSIVCCFLDDHDTSNMTFDPKERTYHKVLL